MLAVVLAALSVGASVEESDQTSAAMWAGRLDPMLAEALVSMSVEAWAGALGEMLADGWRSVGALASGSA